MIRRLTAPIIAFPALLAACSAPLPEPPPALPVPPSSGAEITRPTATRVLDEAAAQQLVGNKGITLQWLGWDQRGSANARWQGGVLLLTAAQARSGGGRLYLDGFVEEIGRDYFKFRGTIRIEDTPDQGRRCEASKSWQFAVTQNRPYWRLREFEWCDRLTDYVDIYF